MTFEICPTCGQHHPQGMTKHRTLEGEWCSPAERERASAKVLPSADDTVNAFMRNVGELAGVRHRAEKAEARIAELERERDELLRVVEAVVKLDENANDGAWCVFCARQAAIGDEPQEPHTPDCAWVLASKLVGAAR